MLLPFHTHFDFPIPGAAILDLIPDIDSVACHFDLVVADRDDDNNLEIEVKWDLPGTAFDSGPVPKKVELPTALVKESADEAVAQLLQLAGVPAPLTRALEHGLGELLGLLLKGLAALKG